MAPNFALSEITMRTEHQSALDLWLRGVLTHEFGSVDGEALPEELLRLLPSDEDSNVT